MFYKVDSTRVTLLEYLRSTPFLALPVVLPLAVFTKIFRIKLPIPTVVPDSLEPFLVNPADIPEEVRAKTQPLEDQMLECGFIEPIYHWICDPYGSRRVCTVTFRHQSGSVLGQITFRQEGAKQPPKEVLYPAFLTAYQDRAFFASTAEKYELQSPPEYKVQRAVGASVAELWRLHQEQLSSQSFGKQTISVDSQEATLAVVNDEHHFAIDFYSNRGILVLYSETEQKTIENAMTAPGDDSDREFAAVHGEIERLANRKASWASGFLILLASVALFLAMGLHGIDWKALTLIVGVLFFHELGHFAAMSIFGYRNLRMFFIPFLGAAVTGQHYNLPGWKKAIVSLAGPVPGIILGVVIAIVAIYYWPATRFVAFMLLGINAFNLLPLMPLDGGQLMHAVIFSRHPAIDVVFRALAGGLLLLMGWLGMKLLAILGVIMLLSLPTTYRVGKVVRRLRKRDFDAASPDGHTIPLETARLIHDELQQVLPVRPHAKTSAQLTLQSFELLNANPPGWLGSIALIGVQGLSFLAAVVMMIGLMHPWLLNIPGNAISALTGEPRHTLRGNTLTWKGADAKQVGQNATNTIIADFSSRWEAEEWYRNNTAKLPAQASVVLFGQTMLIELPTEDEEAREHWFEKLDSCCENVTVHSTIRQPQFTLTCKAPTTEVAKRLARDADSYLSILSPMCLIPPWSPELRHSDDDQKARRTYQEICNQLYSGHSLDQRWIALSKATWDVERRGDVEAVKKLREKQEQLRQVINKERLQRLRNEGEDKWDTSFVDFYEKFPEPETPNNFYDDANTADESEISATPATYHKKLEQWQIHLGSHLGQLPMDGNTPSPQALRFSATYGSVVHEDRTIQLHMRFEQPSIGVLALVDWLVQNGCKDLKYEFRLMEKENPLQ